MRFLEDPSFIGREIDHAVRDNHIDRLRRQGNVLDFALEKLDVRGARLGLILAGEGEHLVGHVEAIRLTCGPDPLRRQQHVDTAA